MSHYRAMVREEFALGKVRLLLARRLLVGENVLMEDGTWRQCEDGEQMEGMGILLDSQAVPALLDALRAFVGERGPSEGEVRVLREWLAHERSRVDSLMPPRGEP